MRCLCPCARFLWGILVCTAVPVSAFGITPSQIDAFQDGAVGNWSGGGSGSPVNVATGGPTGAGDKFLQIASGATPLPPRLLMFNQSQWTGDFVAAGVTQVAMDLLNTGASTLPIRITIREGTGGSTTPGYSSTTPFNLPGDGTWHHAVFLLDAANLTGVNTPQPLATDLANVKEFRILASTTPSTVGDLLTAQLGVDNIAAVPEPQSLLLAIAAGGALWVARRRQHE